jgi:hypothetical protein
MHEKSAEKSLLALLCERVAKEVVQSFHFRSISNTYPGREGLAAYSYLPKWLSYDWMVGSVRPVFNSLLSLEIATLGRKRP